METLLRRPLDQCTSEPEYSNTQHYRLNRTLPLHVPLGVAEVGRQKHGDLLFETRLSRLALRSRRPLPNDSVAVLHLHSDVVGELAEFSHIHVPADELVTG